MVKIIGFKCYLAGCFEMNQQSALGTVKALKAKKETYEFRRRFVKIQNNTSNATSIFTSNF
jgi:hypothetical protein